MRSSIEAEEFGDAEKRQCRQEGILREKRMKCRREEKKKKKKKAEEGLTFVYNDHLGHIRMHVGKASATLCDPFLRIMPHAPQPPMTSSENWALAKCRGLPLSPSVVDCPSKSV